MANKTRAAKSLPGTQVKLRFIQHVLPPFFGVIVTLLVFGFFNSQLVAGKLAYTLAMPDTQAIATQDAQLESTAIDPSKPPAIIINKIEVNAPIITGQANIIETEFQKALRRGVVQYPFTGTPGKPGNTVIFGHSSNQVWAPGDYKFVFALLDKLDKGDKIFIEYEGTRYTYEVSNVHVVPPTDVSVLNPSIEHKLTLITCTPVGTSDKRLIVEAKQISPRPQTVPVATKPVPSPKTTQHPLPGNTPSLWQSLTQSLKEMF